MRYISTRGQSPKVSFLDAILAGLAPDGGLYVPESYPNLATSFDANIDGGWGASNPALATNLFGVVAGATLRALAGEAFPRRRAKTLALNAYGGVWPDAVTPLRQHSAPAQWSLELFHGPSLSFKDVAMQLIGPLYEYALKQHDERLTVVCATSGDTGGAAVEALKNRERVDLFVLTPKGRVSDVQRRFMTTSGASNIFALEIDGDFDACQALVKAMFADRAFAESASLSGVNSINWARIVAQSVYYHVAANTLCAPGPVSFAVPTGNFGDAFSGWIAKQMGAPIDRIVVATNSNDILMRAIQTGRYERASQSRATLSPAMDIQVASNFERILFEALDRDADAVRRLYEQFAQSGGFDIPAPALEKLNADFIAVSVSDDETQAAMKNAWNSGGDGYLVCPHTAVGFEAAGRLTKRLLPAPIVSLATAHPAKFPDTVEAATGVRPPLPARCSDLFQRPEKFDSLPADTEAVKTYIRQRSRAWSLN